MAESPRLGDSASLGVPQDWGWSGGEYPRSLCPGCGRHLPEPGPGASLMWGRAFGPVAMDGGICRACGTRKEYRQ